MTATGATTPIHLVDPVAIEVGRPMILMRLGYRRPSQVPERTARLIDDVMKRGRSLLAPKAVYREITVGTAGPGAILFGETWKTESRSVHERFAACRLAVVFAATVGPAVESWGRDLSDSGEMTKGLLADAFGSSAATALGVALEQVVARRFAEKDLEATRRYAPGYGDWPLADQAPLFSLLDASRIGMTLTEDHLMIPAKSISGVIGGRAAPDRDLGHSER
jgi:cobalamin-dependent methionine synthase-like protein